MRALLPLLLLTLLLTPHPALSSGRPPRRPRAPKVDCFIQAFGEHLQGKGIDVRVDRPGCFGSGPSYSRHARFSPRNARVSLRLPVYRGRVCVSSLSIRVIIPYKCERLYRVVKKITYAKTKRKIGSCRALFQKCGRVVSPAAIPYFDMYCRLPGGARHFEQMRLFWRYTTKKDRC